MTTFAFRPQGFCFDCESYTDVIVVYPLTEEATLWLNLIEEALWPERKWWWVNGGHTVDREQWSGYFMEIYKAGWNWSAFLRPHEGSRGFNGGRHGPPQQL